MGRALRPWLASVADVSRPHAEKASTRSPTADRAAAAAWSFASR